MSKESDAMNGSNMAMTAGGPPTPKKRRLLAAVLTASLAAVSVIVYAAGATGADMHHGTGMHGITYAQTDLAHLHALGHHVLDSATPEQKAQIMALADTVKPELETLNEQAIDAQREKVELLLQDNIDPVALEQARIKEQQVADELSRKIDEALVDLVKLMTPEQRAQLRKHVKEHLG